MANTGPAVMPRVARTTATYTPLGGVTSQTQASKIQKTVKSQNSKLNHNQAKKFFKNNELIEFEKYYQQAMITQEACNYEKTLGK